MVHWMMIQHATTSNFPSLHSDTRYVSLGDTAGNTYRLSLNDNSFERDVAVVRL